MKYQVNDAVAGVPYIEQFYGCWEIQERAASALLQVAESIELQLHLQQVREDAPAPKFSVQADNGVARINLHGVLMKQEASMSEGTSTVVARRQIRAAQNDPSVDTILLHIDSPGGTVAGTGDLADAVHQAAQTKQVIAYVEDLAASAAYKIASQATQIVANRGEALVGSLGTFTVVHDMSKMAENEGIKVHVIRAGEFKGAGVPGTEITEAQLEEWQAEINEMSKAFQAIVERGRGKDLSELFDGRVFSAKKAVSVGLIDSIQSLETLMYSLEKERRIMSEETKPKAAAVAEIKKQCRGSADDPEFILEVVDAECTIEEALSLWADRQQERIEQLKKDRDEEVRKREEAQKKIDSGVPPLVEEEIHDGTADPSEFLDLVQKKIDRGMSRAKAVSKVVKEHPEVHASFVASAN
jgi:signal peptide peptidase SppA